MSTALKALRLRCKGDSPDAFKERMEAAMQQRAWLAPPPVPAAGRQPGGGPSRSAPLPSPDSLLPSTPYQATPQPSKPYNQELLHTLISMGYPRNASIRALMSTRNEGLVQAIDFISAFQDQPGFNDDPLAHLEAPQQPYGAASGAYPRYPGIDPGAQPWGVQPQMQYMPPGPNGQYANPLLGGLWPPPGQPPSHPAYVPPPPGGHRQEAAPAGPRTVGLAGLMEREEQRTAETGRMVHSSFRDLESLMQSAKEMVALAEQLRSAKGLAAPGGEEGEEGVDQETQQELVALGIASPVTRQSAGSRYLVELARQLADFLATPLQRSGGVMTLLDVFCIFNRARGSELVSPDDLLAAAKLFQQLGVGLRLRSFPSGVVVVQSAEHTDERVCASLARMVAGDGCGPPLTSSDVARSLGVPLTIAAQHLLTAEGAGVLCRDDGPEGVRFFRNFFREVQV